MHNQTRLRLPEGGAARLYALTDGYGAASLVIVAANPERARLETLMEPGISVMLTHPEAVAWPDWQGELLAAETLAAGGTVFLEFCNIADALRCKARLEGGSA